jgi:hypothetical protein
MECPNSARRCLRNDCGLRSKHSNENCLLRRINFPVRLVCGDLVTIASLDHTANVLREGGTRIPDPYKGANPYE